jgi:hypothetical protein
MQNFFFVARWFIGLELSLGKSGQNAYSRYGCQ